MSSRWSQTTRIQTLNWDTSLWTLVVKTKVLTEKLTFRRFSRTKTDDLAAPTVTLSPVLICRWRFSFSPLLLHSACTGNSLYITPWNSQGARTYSIYPMFRPFGSQSPCPPTLCQSEVKQLLQGHECDRFLYCSLYSMQPMSAWYITVFLFLVRDLLQHARNQIYKTERHTNSIQLKAENKKLKSCNICHPTSVGYKVNWNFFICDFSSRRLRLCNALPTSKIPVVNMNCHASGFFRMEIMMRSWVFIWCLKFRPRGPGLLCAAVAEWRGTPCTFIIYTKKAETFAGIMLETPLKTSDK